MLYIDFFWDFKLSGQKLQNLSSLHVKDIQKISTYIKFLRLILRLELCIIIILIFSNTPNIVGYYYYYYLNSANQMLLNLLKKILNKIPRNLLKSVNKVELCRYHLIILTPLFLESIIRRMFLTTRLIVSSLQIMSKLVT